MHARVGGLFLLTCFWLACGEDSETVANPPGQGGSSPTGGAGGSIQAGAGQAGTSPEAGAAGQGGIADPGGSGGTAGNPIDSCGAALTKEWTRCGKNPLQSAGQAYTGAYPRAQGKKTLGIGDPDVLFDANEPDPMRRYKAFWSATYAKSPSGPEEENVMAIQQATSPDGVTWTVAQEPALWAGDAGAWDATHIETPSVIKLPPSAQASGVVYVMAYAGAGNKKPIAGGGALPWYQLGLAVSSDGVVWNKLPAAQSPYTKEQAGFEVLDGLVMMGVDVFGSGKVADGLVADPEIFFKDGTFHLFYSSFGVDAAGAIAFPTAYGTSHSTSKDTIHWEHQANNPQFFGGTQPSLVTREDGTHELFLVADTDEEIASKQPNSFNPYLGIRRIESKDLNDFSAGWAAKPPRDFSWDGSFLPERQGLVKAGDVLLVGGVYHYFYIGMGGDSSTIPPGYFTTVTPNTPGAQHIGDFWIIEAVTSLNLARRL